MVKVNFKQLNGQYFKPHFSIIRHQRWGLALAQLLINNRGLYGGWSYRLGPIFKILVTVNEAKPVGLVVMVVVGPIEGQIFYNNLPLGKRFPSPGGEGFSFGARG